MFLAQKGFCPICEENVLFTSEYAWLRDHFKCSGCGSIPRERALMCAINTFCRNWRRSVTHESSPSGRGASVKLQRECANYSCSQFYPDLKPGDIDREHGFECQNLESLTFSDNSFDLFVTQDVMEHIFNPDAAFREIARVLKPGGMHILTVPIINKCAPTESRARLDVSGEVVHMKEPQYHGNPVDNKGFLVTIDWGYDIVSRIAESAGMPTTF